MFSGLRTRTPAADRPWFKVYLFQVRALSLPVPNDRVRARFIANARSRKRRFQHISDGVVCAIQMSSDDEIFDMRFILEVEHAFLAISKCIPFIRHVLFKKLSGTPPGIYSRFAAAHAPQPPPTHPPLTGIPSLCLG